MTWYNFFDISQPFLFCLTSVKTIRTLFIEELIGKMGKIKNKTKKRKISEMEKVPAEEEAPALPETRSSDEPVPKKVLF
jgi:hypothetical protein